MNENDFRNAAVKHGFGEPEVKDYVADRDGPMHSHEFSVMLLVLQGTFGLNFEESTSWFRAGDICELAADVVHTERAGPEGAKVLLAKRLETVTRTQSAGR